MDEAEERKWAGLIDTQIQALAKTDQKDEAIRHYRAALANMAVLHPEEILGVRLVHDALRERSGSWMINCIGGCLKGVVPMTAVLLSVVHAVIGVIEHWPSQAVRTEMKDHWPNQAVCTETLTIFCLLGSATYVWNNGRGYILRTAGATSHSTHAKKPQGYAEGMFSFETDLVNALQSMHVKGIPKKRSDHLKLVHDDMKRCTDEEGAVNLRNSECKFEEAGGYNCARRCLQVLMWGPREDCEGIPCLSAVGLVVCAVGWCGSGKAALTTRPPTSLGLDPAENLLYLLLGITLLIWLMANRLKISTQLRHEIMLAIWLGKHPMNDEKNTLGIAGVMHTAQQF